MGSKFFKGQTWKTERACCGRSVLGHLGFPYGEESIKNVEILKRE